MSRTAETETLTNQFKTGAKIVHALFKDRMSGKTDAVCYDWWAASLAYMVESLLEMKHNPSKLLVHMIYDAFL